MFEKTLTDLVRGIRNNKKNEAQYISQCIQDIKEELKSDNMNKKSVAIQKLTYLQMLGYDMSWAAFNVVEVMSQTRFTNKRIGYLAASQSFNETTAVVMLATNLIRKDAISANQYEAGIAINTLSNICTTDLARDLVTDVVSLMNSSKPYVRKKAVLVMYKIFLKYPESLRPSFPKLKEKLEDVDQAVISSAVNVVCELARKNPKNYLSLAPTLFKLLTSNYNNWMLIKIIKLFGALAPIEPRLAKKLVEPLSNIINTTPAMSLLYECIQTCTIGMSQHIPLIKLCITKLRAFVEDQDQNLKYLGLLALNNIMKIHPKAVAEHRDLVLVCLDDEDVTIRMRALDLLVGMVNKRNLADIVRKLLEHLERAEGSYRDELVEKIVLLCSQNSYVHVSDFEWYLTVLVQLTHVHGTCHGNLIAGQIMDVVIRVKVIRPFGVRNMLGLLRDTRLLSNPNVGGVCEVLYAAAWIIGEFANYVEGHLEVFEALLQPRVASLPPHIQSVFVQNVLKLYAYSVAAANGCEPALQEDDEPSAPAPEPSLISEARASITKGMALFTQSVYLEVQERACFTLELLKLHQSLEDQGQDVSAEFASLFAEPLKPVAAGAVRKVPIPEGLDLDQVLNAGYDDPPSEDEEEIFTPEPAVAVGGNSGGWEDDDEEEEDIPTRRRDKHHEHIAKQREERKRRDKLNPYMIQSKEKKAPSLDESSPPILPLSVDLGPVDVQPTDKWAQPKRTRPTRPIKIDSSEEMPEGAFAETAPTSKKDSVFDALDVDLDQPLAAHEVLKVQTHRTVKSVAPVAAPVEKPGRGGSASARGARGRGRGRRPPGGEPRRPQQTEGTLIDLGDNDTPVKDVYQDLGSPVITPDRKPKPADGERPRRPRPPGAEPRERRPEGERRPRPRPGAEGAEASDFKPFANNADLSVLCDLRGRASDKGKIFASMRIENKSPEQVTNIEVTFSDTLSVRVAKNAGAAAFAVAELEAGGKSAQQAVVTVSGVTMPQKLKAVVSYDYLGEKRKIETQLVIPCSAFVFPEKLAKEQFASTLAAEGNLQLATTKIAATKDFDAVVRQVIRLLHLEGVQFSQGIASAYGKSIMGHSVAMLMKDRGEGAISVDIKCTEGSLANALVGEVTAAFR